MDDREYINLITRDGNTIEVTFPEKITDDIFEEMRHAMEADNYWNVNNYCDAVATYKGVYLSEINMKQIIGIG